MLGSKSVLVSAMVAVCALGACGGSIAEPKAPPAVATPAPAPVVMPQIVSAPPVRVEKAKKTLALKRETVANYSRASAKVPAPDTTHGCDVCFTTHYP